MWRKKEDTKTELENGILEDLMDNWNSVEWNVIYINWPILSSFYNDVTKKMRQVVKNESIRKDWKIIIYVNSPWGSLDDAFNFISMINLAKTHWVKIITVVTSLAASAASIIAIQWDERYVSEFAGHVIHFPRWTTFQASPSQLDNNVKEFKFVNDITVNIYKKFTKLKDIESKMEQDNFWIWWADDLIKQWFADYKLEESDLDTVINTL